VKPLYPLGQPEKAIGHEPQIDLCVANEQPPALSASGTDPRARYSIKMQRSWKKKMIPPLRGGDFQGIAGLSSDDSLLAENQRRLSGAAQNQASAIAHTGLEVKQLFSTSGRGRNVFLDIPLYRSGDLTRISKSFDSCGKFSSWIMTERILWAGVKLQNPDDFHVSGLSESACLTKSLELPEPFPGLQTGFCRFGQLRRMVLNLSANDRESTHPAQFAAISILANRRPDLSTRSRSDSRLSEIHALKDE